MADAPALGAGIRKDMEVQVLSWAPRKIAARSRLRAVTSVGRHLRSVSFLQKTLRCAGTWRSHKVRDDRARPAFARSLGKTRGGFGWQGKGALLDVGMTKMTTTSLYYIDLSRSRSFL